MTATNTEALIGLGEAARALGNTGRGGKAVHPATLTRWIQTGVRLPDGTRLRLRALRAGAKWATRPDWLAEFLEATTAAHLPAEPAPPPRSPAARRRSSAAAAAELDALGA